MYLVTFFILIIISVNSEFTRPENNKKDLLCDLLAVPKTISAICEDPIIKLTGVTDLPDFGFQGTKLIKLAKKVNSFCSGSDIFSYVESHLCPPKVTSNLFETLDITYENTITGPQCNTGCNISPRCTRALTQDFANSCNKLSYYYFFYPISSCNYYDNGYCFIDFNRKATVKTFVNDNVKSDMSDLLNFREENPDYIKKFDHYFPQVTESDLYQGEDKTNFVIYSYNLDISRSYKFSWRMTYTKGEEESKAKCYETNNLRDCTKIHSQDQVGECCSFKVNDVEYCFESNHLVKMNKEWKTLRDAGFCNKTRHSNKLNACIRNNNVEKIGDLEISNFVMITPDILNEYLNNGLIKWVLNNLRQLFG